MKRVHYGADAFETSDEFARLLLELTATLARAGSAEVVAVPALTEEGGIERLEIVLGPATHLLAEPELTPRPEPVDEQAMDSIRTLLRRNTPHRYEPAGAHHRAAGTYADEY